MKVILQKDVKDLGKVGQLVNVAAGFARNFLFPRKMAAEATEKRIKEYEHLQRVAEAKKKKAVSERQALVAKLKDVAVTFKMSAGETDKIFGSVTNHDVSKELEKKGFSVDKRDIQIGEAIKMLGTHQAKVSLGEGAETTIQIIVERA